ncbi:SusF/SusE family outer membrane protein [Dysgonomonas sp. 25]|uniref:SusF/SusE family outer membrane protein n=1 Tax=Dysgonomonas sp. 25 TaxID=2302933 RepID=UPI0013D04D5C|nr:SusF/SusE family outer membrane protein [Dysgonomonas sp. 25]NDV69394.1 SusF/SusE family outer membrane protein [Dysgonomonas sp. 25]
MKKIHILLFLLPLIIFSACSKDEDKMYVLPVDDATPPSLSVEGSTNIEVTAETYEIFPAILNWSKANFGKDIVVEYILEMDTTENFETKYQVAVGKSAYSKALSGAELSKWAIDKFGAYDEAAGTVSTLFFSMRIAAVVALENGTVINKPDTVFSNVLSLELTPYFQAPAFPTEMYMIGEEFGNFDWSQPGIVTMTPVNDKEGEFWCIRYMTGGKKFKWSPKKAWSGDFNQLGTNVGFTIDGGDAKITTDGMYIVYIDLKNDVLTIEPAKVYGMGDCFGGWSTETYPFTVNPVTKTMDITTTGAGDLRMYASSTASSIGGDWWRMEFILRAGVIEYRGNGGDQEPRVNVAAGKTISLDFNAGTGTIN